MDTNSVSPVETSTPSDSALSRRRMLTVALGGAAAAVVLPAPAWAVNDKRPGAHRQAGPDHHRPDGGQPRLRRAGPEAPEGAHRGDRPPYRRHRLRARRRPLHRPRVGEARVRRGASALHGGRQVHRPVHLAHQLPRDICWQVGASPHAALDTTVTGDVIDVGAGDDADYPADAAGKIVLIDYVAGRREQHVATAIANGAAAVIFLPVDREEPRRAPTFNPTLPGSAPTRSPSRCSAWPRPEAPAPGAARRRPPHPDRQHRGAPQPHVVQRDRGDSPRTREATSPPTRTRSSW